MKPFLLTLLGFHLLVLDMAVLQDHITGASKGAYLPLAPISRRFGGWQFIAITAGTLAILTLAARMLHGWFKLARVRADRNTWDFVFLTAVAWGVAGAAWWVLKVEWLERFWR